MPFKSEKQKRFLYANEPEIAERWSKKYGSEPEEKGKKKKSKKKAKTSPRYSKLAIGSLK